MFARAFRLLPLAALAAASASATASAGCCPAPACGCAPPPVEMLIVNQGPVYSGPGPYVTQRNYIEGDQIAPKGFPYVGYVPAETYLGGQRYFYGRAFYARSIGGDYMVRYRYRGR
jgi:hypothetical protein